jgi:hypothetical protein
MNENKSEESSDNCRFLDTLTNLGFLNYRSSSLESFKGMVVSKEPFYEVWNFVIENKSVHSNIINAIMNCSVKDITIDRIVNHLE